MKSLLAASILAFTLCLTLNAFAVECPSDMKECKVLFLSADEAKALTQPNGILATAAQARPIDLGATVQYFFTKLSNAPEGEVKKAEVPAAGSGVAGAAAKIPEIKK